MSGPACNALCDFATPDERRCVRAVGHAGAHRAATGAPWSHGASTPIGVRPDLPKPGALLREARERAGLTVEQVAARVRAARGAGGRRDAAGWAEWVRAVERDAAGLSPPDLALLAVGYDLPAGALDAGYRAWRHLPHDLDALRERPDLWPAVRALLAGGGR